MYSQEARDRQTPRTVHSPSPPKRGSSQGPGDLLSDIPHHRSQATVPWHVHIQCRNLPIVELCSHACQTQAVGALWGILPTSGGASETSLDRVTTGHPTWPRRGLRTLWEVRVIPSQHCSPQIFKRGWGSNHTCKAHVFAKRSSGWNLEGGGKYKLTFTNLINWDTKCCNLKQLLALFEMSVVYCETFSVKRSFCMGGLF